MERPKVYYMTAVKRMLRYVKGSVVCRVRSPATDTGIKYNLVNFIDSNWCEDKDYQRFIAGYIFMFGATLISWCSRKEPVIALSSCEIEYIVASLCVCQAVWLMNLLEEMGNSEGETVTLLVDNVFAINLSKNLIAHGRSKHIEMRFHYLRELVREGRLRLGYCRSKDQLLLTKGVTNDVFKRLKMSIPEW